jgi:hypothetical protein
MEMRKQAVSIRMSASDVRSVKRLAKRLGVRDSDVIRYAVKAMVSKLAPLHDASARGRSLVPVFVESGSDLFRHFDLDAMRLDVIINEGADEGTRVDQEDIQLIAMNGVQRSYIKLRLGSIGAGKNAEREPLPDNEQLERSLREYLYNKYIYGNGHETLSKLEEKK